MSGAAQALRSQIEEHGVDAFVTAAAIAAALCGQFSVPDMAGTVISGGAALTGIPLGVVRHPSTWRRGPAATLKPNPHFAANAHDGAPSPLTGTYLYRRSVKSLGASLAGVAGSGVSTVAAGVDPVSSAMHLASIGTTSVHLRRIGQIAAKQTQTRTITEWCNAIRRMKMMKLGSRGVSLAGAAIPVPALQTATGILGAIVSAGIKLKYEEACQICAMEIHWRAFQEQAISGGRKQGTGAAVGPASEIVWELFNRRGPTRILGAYDVAGMVKEPAGYAAIGDKIALL